MVQLVALSPPGRFPTVVRDPGAWWSAVEQAWPAIDRPGLNSGWWRTLCDPASVELLAPGRLGGLRMDRRRAERSAPPADASLTRFSHVETYQSAPGYRSAVAGLARHLDALNSLDPALEFSPGAGVRVTNMAYGSSRDLVDYARADTPLARIIGRALDGLAIAGDAALVDVSSPEDLLTGLITIRLLRARGQIGYAALVDHGYENFSLTPHLAALRTAGTLDSIFDAIVEEKDDREVLVPRIVEALAAGRPLRGYLRLDPAERARLAAVSTPAVDSVAPPHPTFAPWPILFSRVSQRRCYWARCTFCVHNLKYADRSAPSLSEVPRAVEHLRAAAAAGYRQAILSDEALSPAMLGELGSAILADGLLDDHPSFRWACRSKLERAHDSQLLALLGRAGCVEILFGLESTSDRVLGMMDKRSPGLTTDEVRRILGEMDAAGIGAHANIIVGFPGETLVEARATIAFLADALAPLHNATYQVNPFALFAGTPIAQDPGRFGIDLLEADGDIAWELPYAPRTAAARESAEVRALQPDLGDWLASRLGWHGSATDRPARLAQALYFGTGHGLVFKASGHNPMDRSLSHVA